MRLPAFVLCLAAAGTVVAQPARDALLEVAKCADVGDGSERLRCYDVAARLARSALAEPAPPVAKERSLLERFGLVRPPEPVRSPADFGKLVPPSAPEEVTQISASVVEFAKNARGRAIFILDNGQVWRQADGDSAQLRDVSVVAPMRVTIAAGAFTSFNLTIEGRTGLIKVTRMQ